LFQTLRKLLPKCYTYPDRAVAMQIRDFFLYFFLLTECWLVTTRMSVCLWHAHTIVFFSNMYSVHSYSLFVFSAFEMRVACDLGKYYSTPWISPFCDCVVKWRESSSISTHRALWGDYDPLYCLRKVNTPSLKAFSKELPKYVGTHY
jgi:hypothetical protein